jgi:CMP-N,N'-diacetyllegionaminic acid synthase
MYSGKRILAVVPARSGSKGLPNKNVLRLDGVSLIGHAGRCLAALGWLDARVISTDSEIYADEGRKHGLEAPFLRPPELSHDRAGAIETLQHAVVECERYYGVRYDVVLIVEPTSPLRLPSDVQSCVERLLYSGADSVVAVSPVDTKFHPRKLLRVDEGGRISFFQPDGGTLKARQDLDGGYVYRNGVCYALTRGCLMDQGRIFTENTQAVVIDRPIVNIDVPLEMAWAEFLLHQRAVPRPDSPSFGV